MPKKERSIKSDLKRFDKLKDADIDYSDSPALDDSFFERNTIEMPKPKDSITLRVDHNVLEWFKKHGRGYQTKMNAVLKAYVQAHRD